MSSGGRFAAYRARRRAKGLPLRPPKTLNGPKEVGQVGRNGGSYYLVTRVGKHGGTSGPCVYGPHARDAMFEQLRSKTDYVPPHMLPDEVVTAIGFYALTGKVPGGDSDAK